jgi:hypothetical protein
MVCETLFSGGPKDLASDFAPSLHTVGNLHFLLAVITFTGHNSIGVALEDDSPGFLPVNWPSVVPSIQSFCGLCFF